MVPNVTIVGNADMKTALTDLRDVGPYVAKIITDDRTANKYVFCYGELLSQEEVFAKLEEISREKIERQYVSVPDPRSINERITLTPLIFSCQLTSSSPSATLPRHHLDTTSPT